MKTYDFRKFLRRFLIAYSFLKVRFFSKKLPLFVGWDLTYRCNYTCVYCKIPNFHSQRELTTDEILLGIDQLSKAGMKRIHFGGGEVLLRNDLDRILSFCKEKNISTIILTNGYLFQKKLDTVKKVSAVNISLDGPREIHDALRHEGSFDKVIEAIDLAKKHGIKTSISTTLSKKNIGYIDYILDIAKRTKVGVKFQLLNSYSAGDKNISHLKLSVEEQKSVLEKIMNRKKKNKYIINSAAAIKYMHDYPEVKRIKCAAGRLYMRISPEGYFYPCQIIREYSNSFVGRNVNEIFNKLPEVTCTHCLCTTTLELNYIYNLNITSIINGLVNL